MPITLYICKECNHIFREEDAGSYRECVGEFWGAPAFEEFSTCPKCGSEYIEEYYEPDKDDDYE